MKKKCKKPLKDFKSKQLNSKMKKNVKGGHVGISDIVDG